MLETSALGLGQDIGSQLIRLVWLEPSISPRTIFKPPGSAEQKFWVSLIALLSLCRMYESHLYEMANAYDCLVFQESVFIEEGNFVEERIVRCFAMLQGISLSHVFGIHSGLTTDVRSQNCCSCLDLICDRGVRTKGSRKFVPRKRHPPIPCFVGVGLPRFLSCLFEDVPYSYRSSVTSFPYMPHFTSKTQRA
ncbi:hypothetical protein F2Q69_00041829 [Brassica cretica]|uniref:Uncharacterized protein n=1 Tax=Brassica cretica TaxID=69181 RepID=A0A8S9NVC4_BRACR|nr:hypothetical protein F2Q69_00041829 [Brassica cretica]